MDPKARKRALTLHWVVIAVVVSVNVAWWWLLRPQPGMSSAGGIIAPTDGMLIALLAIPSAVFTLVTSIWVTRRARDPVHVLRIYLITSAFIIATPIVLVIIALVIARIGDSF